MTDQTLQSLSINIERLIPLQQHYAARCHGLVCEDEVLPHRQFDSMAETPKHGHLYQHPSYVPAIGTADAITVSLCD